MLGVSAHSVVDPGRWMERGLLRRSSNPACAAISQSSVVACARAWLLVTVGPSLKERSGESLRFVLGKLPVRSGPSPWRRTSGMKVDEVQVETLATVHVLELEKLTTANPPPPGSRTSSLAWINNSINKLTKWIVLVAVAGVVVWRHDEAVLWAGVGAIVNSGNSKLLKALINQERPLSALHTKADPGMPSSHAQSLGYVACYAAIGYLSLQGLHPGGLVVVSGIVAVASFMAWLRVAEGLHTGAQVIVGAVVGSITAGLWFGLWLKVGIFVAMHQWARYSLFVSAGIATVIFYIFGVGKWTPER